MREVLCLSEKLKTVPELRAAACSSTCGATTPTRRAARPTRPPPATAISLGDMPQMQRLLKAAIAAGRIASARPGAFWVTEFGWDTAPADPKGVPLALHARWVSEALYRMWNAGVSLVRLVPAARRPAGRAGPVRAVVPLRRRASRATAEARVAAGVPVPVRGVPLRQAACASGAGPRTASRGRVVIERSRKAASGAGCARCAPTRTAIFRKRHPGARARAASCGPGSRRGARTSVRVLAQAAARPARQPLRFHRVAEPITYERTVRCRSETRQQSNGRVDVSVLVPVLNEERHIRESVAAMLGQRYDGEIEFLFMDGRSEDRTKAILEEMAAADHRIRVLDNPQQRTTFGLNIGLENARGDYVVRMDAHTEYPPEYVAKGIERLQRGDGVEWVTGPADPARHRPVVAARRDRADVLARRRRLEQVGGRGGEGHRHRRLHGRLEALDARRVRRLGRRLARQPGLRAGGAVLRARQPDRLHARAGRAVRAARLARRSSPSSTGATASTAPRPAATTRRSMRRSAIFPPALVLAAGWPRCSHRARSGSPRRSRSAPGPPRCSARARAPRASTRRATPPACRRCSPTMHLSWGLGFLRGCLRLRAAAGRAGADRRPAPRSDG